jgi:hypothetical protein
VQQGDALIGLEAGELVGEDELDGREEVRLALKKEELLYCRGLKNG